MREAVVVASSRTALAKSFRGSFNMTRPEYLAPMLELSTLDHPNQKADFFPPQIVAAFLNALAKRSE
jgi:hypothetical protein